MSKFVTIASIIENTDDLMMLVALNSNLQATGTDQYMFDLYFNGRGYLPSNFESLIPRSQISNCEITPFEYTRSELLNKSLRNLKTAFWCYLSPNMYMSNHWLSQMLLDIESYDNAGLIIVNDHKTGYLTTSLNSNDELEQVKIPAEFNEEHKLIIPAGCWLMSKATIDRVGAFNQQLTSGYELCDYVRRVQILGKQVIYGRSHAMQLLPASSEFVMFENDYLKLLQERKLPNYIKLGELSDEMQEIIKKADTGLINPNVFWKNSPERLIVNEAANSFAMQYTEINADGIDCIAKFAHSNKLDWNLMSVSDKLLCVFTNKNQ